MHGFHNNWLVSHLVQIVILSEAKVVVLLLEVFAILFHGVDFVLFLHSDDDNDQNDNKKETKSAGCRHYCDYAHVALSFSFFRFRSARLFFEIDWSRRHVVRLSTLRTICLAIASPSTIAGASLKAAGAGSVAMASQNFTVKMHYWMVFNITERLNTKTLFGAHGVRIIEG